jgi:ATP-dependent Clp protease ATP-binding subunit ClpC
MEDGILTDAQGRRADARHAVVIMTSNVGAEGISEEAKIGFSASDEDAAQKERIAENAALRAVRSAFRPEFVNRLDEIVVFRKLSDEDIAKIAKLMLAEITKRIENLGIAIEFSDEVTSLLAKEGFDDVYGARPLRRAIQRKVEDSFSVELLEGNVKKGDSVKAVLDDGKIVYKKVDAACDGGN